MLATDFESVIFIKEKKKTLSCLKMHFKHLVISVRLIPVLSLPPFSTSPSLTVSAFLKVTLVHWACLNAPRDSDAKLLRVKAAGTWLYGVMYQRFSSDKSICNNPNNNDDVNTQMMFSHCHLSTV